MVANGALTFKCKGGVASCGLNSLCGLFGIISRASVRIGKGWDFILYAGLNIFDRVDNFPLKFFRVGFSQVYVGGAVPADFEALPGKVFQLLPVH